MVKEFLFLLNQAIGSSIFRLLFPLFELLIFALKKYNPYRATEQGRGGGSGSRALHSCSNLVLKSEFTEALRCRSPSGSRNYETLSTSTLRGFSSLVFWARALPRIWVLQVPLRRRPDVSSLALLWGELREQISFCSPCAQNCSRMSTKWVLVSGAAPKPWVVANFSRLSLCAAPPWQLLQPKPQSLL